MPEKHVTKKIDVMLLAEEMKHYPTNIGCQIEILTLEHEF